MSGRFITFEGPEGAGKSTQIRLLADYLAASAECVQVTHEPGATPLGARLRELILHTEGVCPRAELLLMAADRAEHVERTIRPALAKGEWVLCDRYVDSTTAYQGGGLGLPVEEIEAANRLATSGLMPELTLVLLIDPALGLARKGRGIDRIEARALSFHERVAAAYRALCEREPHRCVLIAVDELSVAAVHARVKAALREHLGYASEQV